jgi:hypothetical protein
MMVPIAYETTCILGPLCERLNVTLVVPGREGRRCHSLRGDHEGGSLQSN